MTEGLSPTTRSYSLIFTCEKETFFFILLLVLVSLSLLLGGVGECSDIDKQLLSCFGRIIGFSSGFFGTLVSDMVLSVAEADTVGACGQGAVDFAIALAVAVALYSSAHCAPRQAQTKQEKHTSSCAFSAMDDIGSWSRVSNYLDQSECSTHVDSNLF